MIPSGTARTYWVYIFMTTVVALGLWAILSYGTRRLKAPPDISGNWVLLEPEQTEGSRVRIVQSGLFLRIYWPGRDPVGLRMIDLSSGRDQFTLVNEDQTYGVRLNEDRTRIQWVEENTGQIWLLGRSTSGTARSDAR